MKCSTTQITAALLCIALLLTFNQSEKLPPATLETSVLASKDARFAEAPALNASFSSKEKNILPPGKIIAPYTKKAYDRATFLANLPFFAPVISATKTDALVTDNGTPGATPGDVIEYTIVINNTGAMDATAVAFSDQIDPNTTFVGGSLNASPIGGDDAYNCLGNVGINVPAGSGLLINDIDPFGGSPLTVTAVNTTSTQGTVAFTPTGSFTFMPSPGFEGTTTFTYTVSDGLLTDETTVTIKVNKVIWFVDNSAFANGDGRLGTPFNSLANFNIGAADDPDDIIFLYRNTTTNYTGPLTLLNGQALIGAGAPSSIIDITGIVAPMHSNTLPATGGAFNPVIAHNANNLTLAQNNKLHGFDLSNTDGTSLIGNGLGTLQVRDVTVNNTGGTAIDLNNGMLDVIFPSVSASNTGADYGIDVTNTTGSIEIQAGTISNVQQRGANFENATNVTLKSMDFNNANTADAPSCSVSSTSACHAALYFTNITTLVLDDVDVNTTEEQGLNGDNISALTMTNCDFTNCGNAQYEGCVKIRNLHGTCSITNSTFSDAAEELVEIFNTTTPNALSLTVTGCTFSDTFDNLPTGAKGIFVTTSNNTTNNVLIDNCSFLRIGTQGVNLRASAGTMNADVTDCTFSKDTKRFMAGVEIISQGTAVMNINVLRNNITAAGGNAILVQGEGNSFFNARVNNNTIVGPAACSLCTVDNTMTAAEDATCNCTGDGIVVWATVNSSGKANVSSNMISGIDLGGRGIYANARNDADLNILISSNNVATSSNNDAFYNIDITTGAGSGDTGTSFLCANVTGNTVSGNSQFTNFRARTTHATSTLQLQGPVGTIANLWNMNGNLMMSPPTTVSASAFAGSTLTIGGPTCNTTLSHPSALVIDPVVAIAKQEVTTNEVEETPEAPAPPATKGTSGKGNAIEKSGETVTIPAFTLPANKDVTIKFRVTIDPAPHTGGDCQISNQATISGSNFSPVMTNVVNRPLVPPVADFNGAPLTGCIPLQVSFTDASISNGGTINSWAWDIDNDGDTDYTTQNPMHTYTAAGMYTVKLTVTDNLGCTGTETKMNYVNAEEPQVNIAVAPTSVLENMGSPLVFTVTRTGNMSCELTVPFTITGTALEGTDYPDVIPTSFTIPANMNTATLSITPTGDDIIEANETIIITLTDGASYSVGANNSATGMITNDDMAVISIAATDQAMEDTDDGEFTITSTKAFDAPVTINFIVTGSTATSGTDYNSIGTSVILPANQTSVTIPVDVLPDAIVENDETVIVTLTLSSNPNGMIANPPDNSATVTITDDDEATISFTAVPSQNEGNMGTSNFVFTVTLSATVDDAVTVSYNTMNGTATIANADYVASPMPPTNTITFPANGTGMDLVRTITIQVNGDMDFEQNETFKVMLSNIVVGAGRDVTFAMGGGDIGTGTIVNDDTPPVIINEVDADQTGTDAAEFVELYSGGVANVSLDGLVLVFYNGNGDVVYDAIDLDGQSTDANGYFVIGSSLVPNVDLIEFTTDGIQNGADAVALFVGNATDFPNGKEVTTTNLIDAIVYDTDDADDVGLLPLLNAGQPQVDEDRNGSAICHSLQRIPNGSGGLRNTSSYVAVPPTPGAANVVPEVTISVSADVMEDGATNLTYTITRTGSTCSALSVPFTVTGTADGSDYAIDVTSPIPIPAGMSSATITVNPTTDVTVEPNETVIITLTDASASNAYNLGTPAAATGTINNDDATTVVSIERADPNPTNAASVSWTVTFSSPMTGVSFSNFTLVPGGSVAGASITNVMGSGTTWTVTASTGTGDGTLGLNMMNSIGATDAAGNGPTNLTFFGEVYDIDKTVPTVTINQGATQDDPTNMSPIVFDVIFSESVTGFDAADVDLSASTAPGTLVASVSGSGTTYTVEVTGMTGSGTVIASIPVNVAVDAANNNNTASTSTDNTVTYDVTVPTVTINQGATQNDPTNMSPIVFDVVFSEPVTGFDAADVDLSASTAPGTLLASVSGSGTTYTVSVSGMSGNGTVVAAVVAGAAIDAADNMSQASTSTDNEVTYDIVAPTVTINQAGTQADPTNMSPIVFTVQFSEAVTDFDDASDVMLSGTAGATTVVITPVDADTYTVEVSGMANSGTVVATVVAGAAADPAGNSSEASTSTDNQVTYDIVVPTVTINQGATQDDPTNNTPVVFDVVFSEPVLGFTNADVSLAGTTAPGVLNIVVTTIDAATYTVSISGMTDDGLIIASIPANGVTDAAGNNNSMSTSTDNQVTYIFCASEAGEIALNSSIVLSQLAANISNNIFICQGDDPGTIFSATGAQNDAGYSFAFILASGNDILAYNINGDFDLSALTPGTYTVYGLSYATFNTPTSITNYLASVTMISEIIADDTDNGGTFCLDLSDPNGGETASIIVNQPATAEAGNGQTICLTKTVNLTTIGASIGGGASAGTWSTSGDGTFTGGTAFGAATAYVPGTNDKKLGTVTLTLTTTNAPAGCPNVSDQVVIKILKVDCGAFPWNGN